MNKRVVYIGNLHVLAAAVDALREDAADASGVCVVHGAAGIGKTWALRHVAGKFNALFCTALPFWTPHAMLTALARALDEAPLARTTALFAQLTQALSAAPRPIIIDEADRIADRPVLLETLRILHDLTGAPLVFAGMDEMRRAIARRPQIRCRILHAIEFQPLTLDDARKIAAREGTTLRTLVEQGLRQVVAAKKKPNKPFRLRQVTFRGNGLRPELQDASWERILDLSYGYPSE